MGVISRGIKDAFRNGVRTTSIIFILAVSVSMALVMLMALKTVQAKISSVKSSIGNTITVSPAGVRGFEGGGELLTDQNAADIRSLQHVSSVVKTLSDQLRKEGSSLPKFGGDNSAVSQKNYTNLNSAVDPGSFGNRMRVRSEDGSVSTGNVPANFSLPISVLATSDFNVTSSLGISQFDITSGQKFDVNTTDNIALVGSELATKNNLTVDSTFTAYGQTIKVAGIFDTGNKFTNSALVFPLSTLQTLSGQNGQANSIIVQADSIDNVSSVQNEIKGKLGADKVDVVSQQDAESNAIAPLENIKTISLYSLIGALIAGAIIIFLTMMMIVRERRREIGVLKAIGSSNLGIMAQFTVESLVLTLTSSVIGIAFGMIFSNPVLRVLVSNSESSAVAVGGRETARNFGGGAGQVMLKMGNGLGNGLNSARNAINSLHAVVGWEIIAYGLIAAIIIAIIGSAIPSFIIAKIRPAEVMRAE